MPVDRSQQPIELAALVGRERCVRNVVESNGSTPRRPPQPSSSLASSTIDDRRFADLNALHAVHATTAVAHLSGRARLVSTVQAIHEPIPVLQHRVTGVIVDEDGDDQHQPILEGSSTWRGRLRRSDGHRQIAQVDIESAWKRGQVPGARRSPPSRTTSPTTAGSPDLLVGEAGKSLSAGRNSS